MRKTLIEIVTTIAIWSIYFGLMAGAIWFGIYMLQGLMSALN